MRKETSSLLFILIFDFRERQKRVDNSIDPITAPKGTL